MSSNMLPKCWDGGDSSVPAPGSASTTPAPPQSNGAYAAEYGVLGTRARMPTDVWLDATTPPVGYGGRGAAMAIAALLATAGSSSGAPSGAPSGASSVTLRRLRFDDEDDVIRPSDLDEGGFGDGGDVRWPSNLFVAMDMNGSDEGASGLTSDEVHGRQRDTDTMNVMNLERDKAAAKDWKSKWPLDSWNVADAEHMIKFHDKRLNRANGLLKAFTAFSTNEATSGYQQLFLKSIEKDLLRTNPHFLEMEGPLDESQLSKVLYADMTRLTQDVRLCSAEIIKRVVDSTVISITSGMESWMADRSILEDVDDVERFLNSLGVMVARQLHEDLMELDPAGSEAVAAIHIKELSTVWLSTRIAHAVDESDQKGEFGKLKADTAQKSRTDVEMKSELVGFLNQRKDALTQASASAEARLAVSEFLNRLGDDNSEIIGAMVKNAKLSAMVYKDPKMIKFLEIGKNDSARLFGNVMHGLGDDESWWDELVKDILALVGTTAVGACIGGTLVTVVFLKIWKIWSIRSWRTDFEGPPGGNPSFSEVPPEFEPLYFRIKTANGNPEWVRRVDPYWFRKCKGPGQSEWSVAINPFFRYNENGGFTEWREDDASHPPRVPPPRVRRRSGFS